MRKYRYLPHTADMEFRAYGSSFREALENSSIALLNVMLDLKKIGKDIGPAGSVEIRESASEEKELAWFVLQDILSKVDSLGLNAYAFRIQSLKRNGKIKLGGRLLYKRTEQNHALLSVKAVTPYRLSVKRARGRVSINVVVDV